MNITVSNKRVAFLSKKKNFAPSHSTLYRETHTSAHVLCNLLNELRKRDKIQGLLSILSHFATILINSIIREHKC